MNSSTLFCMKAFNNVPFNFAKLIGLKVHVECLVWVLFSLNIWLVYKTCKQAKHVKNGMVPVVQSISFLAPTLLFVYKIKYTVLLCFVLFYISFNQWHSWHWRHAIGMYLSSIFGIRFWNGSNHFTASVPEDIV